jgi:hypothetical protein
VGTPVGASMSVDIAGVQSDTNDIQTRLPVSLLGGRMRASPSIASGTATGGSTSTLSDTVNLVQADPDWWKGLLLVFTSGNLLGQTAFITGFNPATDTLSFAPNTTQPVVAQTYEIWPVLKNVASTTDLETAISDMLVQYRLDELLAADSDVDGAQPPVVGSVFHELLSKTPASFTYDQTTDSLEATADALTTAQADLDNLQTRVPATLDGNGRLRTVVEDVASSALDILIGPLVTVVANVPLNTALTFQTNLGQTGVNFAKDAWLVFMTGALAQQVRRITLFNPTTDFVTVHEAYTAIPAAGDTARLINR